MSCERNCGAFIAHVGGAGSSAAQAFGGTAEASAALETIFDTARRQPVTTTAERSIAEAKTRLLFAWMRQSGFQPPTHSPTRLPKPDAQRGYAALYDTVASLRDGKPLPALAAQLVDTFGQQRDLSAIRLDEALVRLRCSSCGQFAPAAGSSKPPHICRNTTTPEYLQRALQRRLGVPAGAYPADAMAGLIAEARKQGVAMRHPITNEPIRATLDALPLAITQGYVPEAWQGANGLALVEVSNGRIAPVLDATGLTQVLTPDGALAAAAVGSGTTLSVHTTLVEAEPAEPVMCSVAAPADVPSVSGGSTYDVGRFVGTEYRKGKGTVVEAAGRTYTVGERSDDPADWGEARRQGLAPEPPKRGGFKGIAVGRTLVEASEILRTGKVLRRPDKVIEVYDCEGGMVAVYDPATRTAGDVYGTPNASAAQMAAVVASHVRNRESDLDECVMTDLVKLQSGRGSPIALADGAYLVIKADLDAGKTLTLGGSVSATKCPECGRFMGAAGCQGDHAQTSEDETTAPSEVVVAASEPVAAETVVTEAVAVAPAAPAPAVTLHVDPPQVTVNVETPQVTVEVPQVTVQLDADAVARRVAERVPVATDGGTLSGAPVPAPDTSVQEAMISVLGAMVQRLERLERPAEPAAPVASAPTPAAPRVREPRADRPVPASSTMTDQERIVVASELRMPRPDPELSALDRKVLPATFVALDEAIPEVKRDYVMNARERQVMQRMVSVRSMGMKMGRVNETRSFGIYGPPGTGKNELARQFAASMVTVDADGNERQGVHFEQVEFDKDMDTGMLIGTTALENGTTVARLGPVGLAAVQGSVICLNEVVRNPKALTQFQSMIEEGEIRLKTPEAGIITIPIHPATTFVQTWNPGLEGDADRPAEAPRSRTISMELPAPTPVEQAARVKAFFSGAPAAILPKDAEVNAAITFFNQLRAGITNGSIQQRGRGSKAMPGPRDLNYFVLAGKTDGWAEALEQMRIFGDQNFEDRENDWKFIKEQFAINFGADGRAHSRATSRT